MLIWVYCVWMCVWLLLCVFAFICLCCFLCEYKFVCLWVRIIFFSLEVQTLLFSSCSGLKLNWVCGLNESAMICVIVLCVLYCVLCFWIFVRVCDYYVCVCANLFFVWMHVNTYMCVNMCIFLMCMFVCILACINDCMVVYIWELV